MLGIVEVDGDKLGYSDGDKLFEGTLLGDFVGLVLELGSLDGSDDGENDAEGIRLGSDEGLPDRQGSEVMYIETSGKFMTG